MYHRLEKLASLLTIAGKAKVLGTLIGGAMLLTFYKGVEINIWSTNVNLLHQGASQHTESTNKPVLGCLLSWDVYCLWASCLSYALWLIIQAKMSKNFPCRHSSTALMSLMAAIQSTTFGLCKEKD
ncbi:hypothetical protein Patl1_23553 [Pistacia atlantica]|uniref:Uncharacterized protein n=1 Tax=Pistacia atlantica TaxID=434234 RepID=A0ACC0ZUX4_9ROSI|nr:hypothetical protein Patl1_23553 [Pistacia atlantica]